MPVYAEPPRAKTTGRHRERGLFGPRPETSSLLVLGLMVALMAAAAYSAYLLVRHIQLADHARSVTTALTVTELSGEFNKLQESVEQSSAAGDPSARERLLQRLHAANNQLALLRGDPIKGIVQQEIALDGLADRLRQATGAAEEDLRQGGDTVAVTNLAALLRRMNQELVRIGGQLHADARTANAEILSTLRRDHWVLVGIVTILVGCGLFLLALLARHKRLLSSARQEVDALVDHLRQTGADLRTQNARFQAALTNMSQALCVADSDQCVVVHNDRLNEMFGLDAALTRPGTPVAQVFAAIQEGGQLDRGTLTAVQSRQRTLIAAGQAGSFTLETSDGRAVAVSHQPMPGGGWVATYEDVTDRQKAHARIRFMALHDGLTGLPNRAALTEQLATLLRHLRRHQQQLAILTINLDHFRTINEALGHDAGDLLLQAAARRLRNAVRDSDFVARIGDDEFVVLQTSDQHPGDAELLARRLVGVLATPYEIDRQQAIVTASIGIAIATGTDTDPDLLLTHADTSLDRAKAEGRDTYRFFDPAVDARVQERRAMEHDLREAMARGDFMLLYQPIWDLTTNRVTGFEALLRWMHPDRGMISPGAFIPLAEELGLIGTIGTWVIGQACDDAAQWPDEFSVSVNLSAAQFLGDRLETIISQALADTGLSPRRLILEITETVLLRDDARIVATLHALRRRGIRIALDDFGTGYSSLSYLVSFPFDKLKIDQSFVRDIKTRPECRIIVHSILSLASELGIATTAEGVETAEQMELVRVAGCADAQGYHFARPEPANAIRRWFEPVKPYGQTAPACGSCD